MYDDGPLNPILIGHIKHSNVDYENLAIVPYVFFPSLHLQICVAHETTPSPG